MRLNHHVIFALYWMDGGNVYVFLIGVIDLFYYHYSNSFFPYYTWQSGKMASDINMHTKEKELIDFLHEEIDIHQQLLNIYGDQRGAVNTGGGWYVSSVTKLYDIYIKSESYDVLRDTFMRVSIKMAVGFQIPTLVATFIWC